MRRGLLPESDRDRYLRTMAEPRVKGIAFKSVDTSFAELRGAEARIKARSLMNKELADTFRNSLMLAASWYPIGWYSDVLRSFREATGDGPDLIRQIGYRCMELDMKSVHKQLFARFVSPQTMLSMGARMFNNYYDTGKFEVLDGRRGFVHVKFSGCLGWDANMFQEMVGSSTAMLELSGGRDARARVTSGGRDGDTSMELDVHWT